MYILLSSALYHRMAKFQIDIWIFKGFFLSSGFFPLFSLSFEKGHIITSPIDRFYNINILASFLLTFCSNLFQCISVEKFINYFTVVSWKKKASSSPFAAVIVASIINKILTENKHNILNNGFQHIVLIQMSKVKVNKFYSTGPSYGSIYIYTASYMDIFIGNNISEASKQSLFHWS